MSCAREQQHYVCMTHQYELQISSETHQKSAAMLGRFLHKKGRFEFMNTIMAVIAEEAMRKQGGEPYPVPEVVEML